MKQKYLGIGIGVRRAHFEDLLADKSLSDWFEIVSENYLTIGGKSRYVIDTLAKNRPIVAHGLSLSLASAKDPDKNYLDLLKKLVHDLDCPWFSDHLCISGAHSANYYDLIPPLRTEESLEKNIQKINYIKNYIQKPFAIENISHYAESTHNTIDEVDYINRLAEETDSLILLDINNVYVNYLNHNLDAKDYLSRVNADRVVQFHLAGHFQREDIVIDTHGEKVCEEVWSLYEWYLKKVNRPISTLIEWDHSLPSYNALKEEAEIARKIVQKLFGSIHEIS
ncbi:DUF692 domain-containing protein [Bacteriovoracaceae bacterium]|nr:DUF692 domain-containing protein [Bacteriovoracaceae bacterium]